MGSSSYSAAILLRQKVRTEAAGKDAGHDHVSDEHSRLKFGQVVSRGFIKAARPVLLAGCAGPDIQTLFDGFQYREQSMPPAAKHVRRVIIVHTNRYDLLQDSHLHEAVLGAGRQQLPVRRPVQGVHLVRMACLLTESGKALLGYNSTHQRVYAAPPASQARPPSHQTAPTTP